MAGGVSMKLDFNVPKELNRLYETYQIARLRSVYQRTLSRCGMELARRASQKYLRGPRPLRLGVVHGKLYQSVESGVDESHLPMAIEVGTHLVYGAAWELGKVVFGKGGRRGKRKSMKGQKTKRSGRRGAMGVQFRPGPGPQPARPFIQPALEDLNPTFEGILLEEVQRELS